MCCIFGSSTHCNMMHGTYNGKLFDTYKYCFLAGSYNHSNVPSPSVKRDVLLN